MSLITNKGISFISIRCLFSFTIRLFGQISIVSKFLVTFNLQIIIIMQSFVNLLRKKIQQRSMYCLHLGIKLLYAAHSCEPRGVHHQTPHGPGTKMWASLYRHNSHVRPGTKGSDTLTSTKEELTDNFVRVRKAFMKTKRPVDRSQTNK